MAEYGTETVTAVNTSDIDPKRYSLKCILPECRASKRPGACIQCSAKGCTTAVHPRCGFLPSSGFCESDEVDEDGDLKLELICPIHNKSRKAKNESKGKAQTSEKKINDVGSNGKLKSKSSKNETRTSNIDRDGGYCGKQKVYQYELMYPYTFIKEFASTIEAAKSASCETKDIYECCMGRLDSAGGYDWVLQSKMFKKQPLEQYGMYVFSF